MAAFRGTELVQAVVRRRGVRQFVKFCLVGTSSTLIDFGLFWLLLNPVDLRARLLGATAGWPELQSLAAAGDLHIPLAVTLAFLVAVTNSFFWNSRWTFRGYGRASRRRQYVRFVLVNLVGLLLNVLIVTTVRHLIPLAAAEALAVLGRDPRAIIAKAVATSIVVFWNFGANKYWTFSGKPGS